LFPLVLSVILLLLGAACGEEESAALPPPQEITRDAIGHYCGMIVADHPGPKAQIFLADAAEPLWFSSVRDAVAFTLLPEEPKTIATIYVNDMGRADWESPQAGTWIDAKSATYVIGSERTGGMGAPETAPFAERRDAETFAARHGGKVVTFADIPPAYIFAPAEDDPPAGHAHDEATPPDSHGHGAAVVTQ
jgi:copper chaperone NosL